MKFRHLCVGALVLALVAALGCKKPEEETSTTPIPGPTKVAKAPAEPAKGGEMPALGEKIKLTPEMPGEKPEEAEFEVAEIDTAKLKELGVDAYPGAVGVKDTAKPDDPTIAMLTRDDVAKVAEHYTKAGLKDQTEAMKALAEGMANMAGEMAKSMGAKTSVEEAAKAKAEMAKAKEELSKLNMVMLGTADGKTSVIIVPAGEYSLIGVGPGMGDMSGMESSPAPAEPAKTE